MGAESTSGSGESNETQVVLNVYDLTPINNYMCWFGFGIFHSGIEVHGKEYGFGAHDFPVSAVFEVEPRNCPGFLYRNSIQLGKINMPPSEFRSFIEGMASEYHGDTYHLISKNCNHFTDDVSLRLTGRHIPGWVNRLARLGVHGTVASFCLSVKSGVCDLTGRNLVLDCLGAVCSCLLPESLQVNSVKQLSEYPEYSDDDASESISNATPRESTEVYDTDQEKHLLSPPGGCGEVVFVKEAKSDSWSSSQELKMPIT